MLTIPIRSLLCLLAAHNEHIEERGRAINRVPPDKLMRVLDLGALLE